jgi:DNA-binding NarL/FixJ family response regulator
MKKGGIITVVVADDHEIIRDAISAFFKESPQLKIVGLAKDGREAIHVVTQLRPRVVLMDI